MRCQNWFLDSSVYKKVDKTFSPITVKAQCDNFGQPFHFRKSWHQILLSNCTLWHNAQQWPRICEIWWIHRNKACPRTECPRSMGTCRHVSRCHSQYVHDGLTCHTLNSIYVSTWDKIQKNGYKCSTIYFKILPNIKWLYLIYF